MPPEVPPATSGSQDEKYDRRMGPQVRWVTRRFHTAKSLPTENVPTPCISAWGGFTQAGPHMEAHRTSRSTGTSGDATRSPTQQGSGRMAPRTKDSIRIPEEKPRGKAKPRYQRLSVCSNTSRGAEPLGETSLNSFQTLCKVLHTGYFFPCHLI